MAPLLLYSGASHAAKEVQWGSQKTHTVIRILDSRSPDEWDSVSSVTEVNIDMIEVYGRDIFEALFSLLGITDSKITYSSRTRSSRPDYRRPSMYIRHWIRLINT